MSWSVSWREREWDKDLLLEMYRLMVRIRHFEDEGEVYLRRGDFSGPYHASIGQEAACVGPLVSLRGTDYVTGTHRSHGHQIAKGAPLKTLAAEIWGRRTGVCKGKGGSMHVADFSVGALGASALLGGAMGIATGAALAQKLDGTDGVVVCYFGDGVVNEGTFHETLNWAATWKLPVIFLCENNQYAVTMWYGDTTSVDVLSKRAVAYDIPGRTVDGMNALQLHHVCEEAIARARAGEGPSLIEAMTYRYKEHSTRLVMPTGVKKREGILRGYRESAEIEAWQQRDPIIVLAATIVGQEHASESELDRIEQEEIAQVRDAWQFAADSDWPDVEEIWTDTWPEPVQADKRVELI
ncbi:thiamine pyrophosphate-dependent dehydrogenase E1 component subunit alpha [Amycolatopsis pithecellobii]|uniref:Pyruvate dehydrogenase (Acetyl-transferring) E1 component subunit alpha n=1 Tax=Amycolatopsis pithecellobii TaxID=664692 RepID=A0A6N7YUP9_9PSEU|nr:thiamine pyrophosphate-dependent dehydrogenase E1 component subunit alpha [Amycolatopsis pithecellobii]MTD55662.1 pyruvate dehydrogenase (acetyl-transferring) E1 component subunit alpha [Amycolatopsis pithecellobii]